MSTIIAVVSDSHVGSTTAIAPPRFGLHTGRKEETQQAEYNQSQKWLHECWKDFFDYVYTLAGVRGKTRKHRLILCHLGDVVDGLHHRSVQVMNEIADQQEAACNLLRPHVAKADAAFLTYGTDAHNGGTAENEIAIARELGINHDWEYALEIDGIPFDLGHHGRASQRDWTSSAAGMASEVALDYLSRGLKPPRYVLRGHRHVIDDSGDKLPYTRAIALPSWQLRTAFGYKVATNRKRSDIGGLIFDTSRPDEPIFAKARYRAPEGEGRYITV